MRYTVTGELDPELFSEVERERHSAGLSRSAAIRQALEWWVAQRKEHGEERVGHDERRHRQIMRRLEYLVGMIREQERVAERNERGLSGSRVKDSPDYADGPANGYERGERGSKEAEGGDGDTHGRPARSALKQARERARRRME